MLALAYAAAPPREELCSLRTDDLDPAHRTLRVTAETTKPGWNAWCRTRPRAAYCGRATWRSGRRSAGRAGRCSLFATHTARHLCLTDLARMGWELHTIATFAGHRRTDSTPQYIHLSGRDLADKLSRGMEHIHAWL